MTNPSGGRVDGRAATLARWRAEVRERVEAAVADVRAPAAELATPYREDEPGTAPLLILLADRCFGERRDSALAAAAALESARLHLRTHGALGHDDPVTGRAILAGGLYRSLADQLLTGGGTNPSQSLAAARTLTDAVVDGLEAAVDADARTFDWRLAEGAADIGAERFAVDDAAAAALRAYAARVRETGGWGLDGVPDAVTALPEGEGRSLLFELAGVEPS